MTRPYALVPVPGAPPVLVNGAPTGLVLSPVYTCCACCAHDDSVNAHRRPCPNGCGDEGGGT